VAYKYYDEVIRVALLVYFRFAHSLLLARSPLLTQQAESIGPKRAQRVRETYTESEQGRNKVSADRESPQHAADFAAAPTSLCQLRLPVPALVTRTFHWQNNTNCDIYFSTAWLK
jgi:hypothetical protein